MKHLSRVLLLLAAIVAVAPTVSRAEEPAAIAQRMKSRLAEVDTLKQKGSIGENNKGFLEAKGTLSGAESGVMAAENADRSAIYAELAKRTGASASEVGRTRARKIAAASAGGIWIQDESGAWKRK